MLTRFLEGFLACLLFALACGGVGVGLYFAALAYGIVAVGAALLLFWCIVGGIAYTADKGAKQ